MTGIVSGSLYERLLKEGKEKGKIEGLKEGEKKGKYKKDVIAIQNMTNKKLKPEIIAEFLSLSKAKYR